ncbi:molybdate ABC transporter substrate-binding protein [Chitinolyticbacter meiyuanensis]|uniref:molybdate ABC transporter substrate-binding protein n=1 Tax=Chitinolyticbacter meiyuanensis TaxID=682798 RepID=UPI0011E5D6D3|nr:molybdate ABC transporter substrate-binding protein [Chitinolyticbacter meiyuanensis]
MLRLALLALFTALPLHAAEVRIAVAANFAGPMKAIAADFERASGHTVVMSSGATGKFYAQIVAGAPFDVLLAADDETPKKLEDEGQAVAGSRFTYAVGRLVLWRAEAGPVDEATLKAGNWRKLAIANPKVAPYGRAAVEALTALKLYEAVIPKLVQGENIAQTHQFVASGNADLGFVALSQVFDDGHITSGAGWIVPEQLHQPIRQDAALLKRGADNAAAKALLDYLKSAAAKQVLTRFGYR